MCAVDSHAIKPGRHRRIYHTFHELLQNLAPTTSIPLRILILPNMPRAIKKQARFLLIHLES